MGITHGFLRLTSESLAELKVDASAFESACRNYGDSNYLEMDKAGYELLFILDPASVEYDKPDAASPYPALKDVLSGGTIIHAQIDLGFGPAKIVADASLRKSIVELEEISEDRITEMAMANDILPEVLMCDVDESTVAEYHWPYLQSLSTFIREAVDQNMAVIRY